MFFLQFGTMDCNLIVFKQLAMILLHLASIVWKLVIGVRIENEDGDGEVCGKVKSVEWGDLDTFTEDKAHPHCLGTLRLKKEDGKILCLQKEESYEDYLECNDDETDKSTTDRESSTKSTTTTTQTNKTWVTTDRISSTNSISTTTEATSTTAITTTLHI